MPTPHKDNRLSGGTAFGVWLKQRRNTLGLAQKELAERAGCSVVMIEKMESGERRPSSQVAEMLAECLNVPADEHRAFTEFARARLSPTQMAMLAEAASHAPWRTFYRRSNNLPSPSTAFIGREKEVAAACALLRASNVRLLSMTGPPGIGKTRLSLRVAEELIGDFDGNIVFVGLAPIRDPDLVIPTIAGALNLREMGGETLLESLKRNLGDKRTLLVLDNFEQVVPAAPYVSDLLTSAPWLKVLVTSREILHIYGEYQYQVPPLNLPVMRYLPPVERLVEYEAIRLFIERATAVRPDFVLTAENAPAVVEICTRLDKVPLAIELAAARARTLSPAEIVRRLDSNLELLTGGARDLPPRQRALRSAIDWSYDLLNEGERQLFRRVSVFVGGFTQEAAEAVCGQGEDTGGLKAETQHVEGVSAAADGGISIVAVLDSLIDKSLVRREDANGEPRFSMLETIREYAWWRLVGRGGDTSTQRRYINYYAALAEQAKADMKGPQQLAWLQRLEAEHNNLRAVLRWALNARNTEIALGLSGTLWRFWLTHGHLTEGRKWLMSALEPELSKSERKSGATSEGTGEQPGGVPGMLLANALSGAGNLACACGDFASAQPLYERSLAIRRKQGDKAGIAGSLNNLALIAHSRCDYARVKALHEESLAIKRDLGDKWGIASSLGNLGIVANDQGNYSLARALHEESLAMRRELGDNLGVALSLLNLGIVVLAEALNRAEPELRLNLTQPKNPQGPDVSSSLFADAQALYEESLNIRKQLEDRPGIAECLARLGEVEHCRGNYTRANYLYQQSLEICRELGDKPGISNGLLDAGHVDIRQGHPRQAAMRFSDSLTIRKQLSDTRGIIEGLAALAGAAAALAKPSVAGRLFGATNDALRTTTFHLYAVDRLEYDRNMAAASSLLNETAWAVALSEGATMSLDEAAGAALQLMSAKC
jgi:predicted ATPase/transcriptional regulator with XRE-family HTH domain